VTSGDDWDATFRLRAARGSDHALYLRLFPELGVDDEPADTVRFADEMAPTTFVIESASVAAGYAYVQVLDGVGYVRHVVIDAAHRGRGLGLRTMLALADHFMAAGCASWCLNVKPDNRPAVRLYERCGMAFAYRSVSLRLSWRKMAELARSEEEPSEERPSEARPSKERPSRDQARLLSTSEPRRRLTAIEAALGLTPGLLTHLASSPGRSTAVVERNDEPVGVACFDPNFPGCFPFRACDLAAASALLAALRPHAHPDKDLFQVVLEDCPLLVVALEEVGAHRVLAFAHYRGQLPPPERARD
jgi:ribosomal protein S18 acetylase RimI-like enzyme